jgi:hypothetical protein
VTTFYGVSAPLASGKTTAAIEYAGRAAQAGEKFVIAQPSINLINQSIQQFQERWPNVAVRAIHSETTSNVVRAISDHTKVSTTGEVLFVTHASLMQSVYWHHRRDWHLVIDEAPQVFYHAEFTLPANYSDLLPALEIEPHNVRYSRLLPGDVALLEDIATNRQGDQVHALFQEFAAKLASNRWEMFVLNEQWERFQNGQITDGKLLVFGLIDPVVFNGFATTTIMSANLESTAAYQYLVQRGHAFQPHKAIISKLRFTSHVNGGLLTIHYAIEDGNWSKHKRDRQIEVAGDNYSVNELIICGALDLFGDDQFVWLANKDIEDKDPFGGRGTKLPHSCQGLNTFQHVHNAAVLAALNPSPALYAFLDEVAHLNSDEVRRAVYHEAAYQAAGRISTRNLADHTPKHVVVADRAAAEALAELYPGADVVRLPFASLIPESAKRGPKRVHSSDAARNAAYRDRRKAELLAELDRVNEIRGETNLPYTYKDNSSRTDGKFGGSVFADIYSKLALDQAGALAVGDFAAWLRDLHDRVAPKSDAFLWSPAEFEPNMASDTSRGLANIKAIWGIWLDCDGGDLRPDEFAAMFPHLTIVTYNSASSTVELTRWRAVIPTTCAMTIDVHRDILMQLMKSLNRRGYYSKKQLEKRSQRGLGGKQHGFDPSKFAACSLFYLPAQAAAGPDASFFLTFDDAKRQPIDPYHWIDRSIIDERPAPEPKPVQPVRQPMPATTACPKLMRMRELIAEEEAAKAETNQARRQSAAIERWRHASPGDGNVAFLRLGHDLNRIGMSPAEIDGTLRQEAGQGRHPSERRAQIKYIIRSLRGSPGRMAA